MRRWMVGFVALGLLAAPAGASTVDQFLGKAKALKAKGVFALMSSDLKLLVREMKAIGADYRKQLAADRAAGRKPESCPPTPARIGQDELMAELEAVPPAQRGMSMEQFWSRMMRKRFPCPA